MSAVQTESFQIESLHCADELALIERGLRGMRGVKEIQPNYMSRTLRVEYMIDETTVDDIARRLRQIGFPPAEPSADGRRRPAARSARLRATTSVAGVLLGCSLAAHLIWPSAIAPAVMAVAAAVLAGWPVAYAAWRAVRLRRVDMNVLMTIAAVGAVATSQFYEAATAMFLFGVAVWLESYSMSRAQRAVHSLVELTPEVAHRIDRGDAADQATDAEHRQPVVDDVPLDQLAVGDHVLIKPGERISVDGEVLSGQSSVNQAPITGESVPVDKSPGQRVYAGSLNGDGALQVRMDRAANDSTLAHVQRLIEQAEASRSPTQRFVDRFASRYTPAVIALAVCLAVIPPLTSTLAGWPAEPDFRVWLHRGLVLLVIACPCALVISTPITIVCGLRRAAQHGILVKGGEFLEAMAAPDCLALDKTGTLTMGTPRVVEVIADDQAEADRALRLAAALEAGSAHPLADAIVQAAEQRALLCPPAADVTSLPGLGVEGKVNGHEVVVASPRHFGPLPDVFPALDGRREQNHSASVALVQCDSRVIGAILFADSLRPHAASVIGELHQLGISRILMLTGDHEPAAQAIAGEIGIDRVYAGLMPEEKVARVEALSREFASVVMVGDGVNDAPALAMARVGIALGSQSSDTAMETADVVVMAPRLTRLPELIRIARRTRRRLTENIGLALSIKLVVLVLAAAGYATMWMAVAADVGASLLVIINGMRLLGRGGVRTTESA